MLTTVGNSLGVQFETIDRQVMNRTGATRAVGDVVRLDNLVSPQAETTSSEYGLDSSRYSNAVLPTTAGLKWGLYGIVLEAAADNAKMRVRLQGRVKANVVGTDATAIGEPLFAANTADTLTSDVTADSKVLGFAEVVTAGATEQQIDILFFGIGMIGNG